MKDPRSWQIVTHLGADQSAGCCIRQRSRIPQKHASSDPVCMAKKGTLTAASDHHMSTQQSRMMGLNHPASLGLVLSCLMCAAQVRANLSMH